MPSKAVNSFTAILLLLLAVGVLIQVGAFASPEPDSPYNRTTVTVVDANGTVDVRIADTGPKRYTGLSNTTSLDPDEGMLFVHPEEGEHAYVMRNMSFPLDIIFVASNGTITTIHHAAVESPDVGETLTRYRGRGQYVLEVNRGWTNSTGVNVGDRVRLPDAVNESDS
jgi:uncharacterized membrane protein (UPF0127 family)